MARLWTGQLHALTRAERGPAVVGFAIIVTVLLTMSLGVYEFGRAFHTYLLVNHAAREGSRYGMDPARDLTSIQSYAVSVANLSGTTAVASRQTSPYGVTVQVSYPFTSSIPAISALWGGGTLNITQTRVARTL